MRDNHKEKEQTMSKSTFQIPTVNLKYRDYIRTEKPSRYTYWCYHQNAVDALGDDLEIIFKGMPIVRGEILSVGIMTVAELFIHSEYGGSKLCINARNIEDFICELKSTLGTNDHIHAGYEIGFYFCERRKHSLSFGRPQKG